MKRVSFKVAKAIKEAGYPQGKTTDSFIIKTWNSYNPVGTIVCLSDFPAYGWELNYYFADIPTYLEVWLWLWKEKKFYIDIAHYYSSDEITVWDNNYKPIDCIDCFNKYTNPEDAIAEAINHLVDNNLIK